jgi:NAD(P)-dependent dehydrogenase (short-subunit alcohol dehydrogenase family)
MRVLVVGATGTIGRAVVDALRAAGHDVVGASRHGGDAAGDVTVDVTHPDSIRGMYEALGAVDAVVSCAGGAAWKPLEELTDADFATSIGYKLMGQVNLVRFGLPHVRDGGSITITSGLLAQQPTPGSAAASLVNSALEGFARAAALEAPRGIRVNVVSPGWVTTTLAAMGQDPSTGVTPEEVARVYVASVTGEDTGAVLPAV